MLTSDTYCMGHCGAGVGFRSVATVRSVRWHLLELCIWLRRGRVTAPRRPCHKCFGLRKWPVKHDGNEHLSSIFLDEDWFSGLHLFQDCDCFVLTQVSFTLPQLFALAIQFVVGPFGPLGFLVPRGMHSQAMWQLVGCKSHDSPGDITVFHLIGRGCFQCDS